MQKEKKVRAYTRKVNGKTVTVKAHTAKYDAAEEARKAFAKREGAGKELEKVKIKKVAPAENDLGFTEADYKAWYHWDMVDDPNNPQALKVKRALTKTMGRKGYQAYEDQMSDTYSARGHMKGFKNISAGSEKPAEKPAKVTYAEKERQLMTQAAHNKERRDREELKRATSKGALVAHINGDASRKYAVTPVSPMVKDVKFTKELEGDAYSDFFPKGGSYEFFYGETKDRRGGVRRGLFAKNGKSIIEIEEAEPSRSLKKALGEPKSSKATTPQKSVAREMSAKEGGLQTPEGIKLHKKYAGKGVFLVGTDGRAYRKVTKKDGSVTYKYSAEDTRYVKTDGGRKLPKKPSAKSPRASAELRKRMERMSKERDLELKYGRNWREKGFTAEDLESSGPRSFNGSPRRKKR